MEERLQKILSAHGVASRRAAEGYLSAGRVTVNGVTAALGDKADPQRDVILVDGLPLPAVGGGTYIMLHKPRGYVTTCADEQGRNTVLELVEGCKAKVWPVGRLDLNSEGLLVLTNDGALTQRLTHPSHEVEKEYYVTVEGDLKTALPVLTGEMILDGQRLRPAAVRVRANGTLSVTIHEGKNRQVRRMCQLAGLTVKRLVRVREGSLRLGELKPGCWRPLTAQEVSQLQGVEQGGTL